MLVIEKKTQRPSWAPPKLVKLEGTDDLPTLPQIPCSSLEWGKRRTVSPEVRKLAENLGPIGRRFLSRFDT